VGERGGRKRRDVMVVLYTILIVILASCIAAIVETLVEKNE